MNSDDDIKYIRELLDKLRDGLVDTNLILTRNTATLEVHVKRCDLLEAKMKPLEEQRVQIQGWKHSIGFVVKVIAVGVPVIALGHSLGMY